MSEMEERVTETIRAGLAADLPSGQIARQAIEAMHVPTEAMLDAGEELAWGPPMAAENEATPRSCWRAMIKAALK